MSDCSPLTALIAKDLYSNLQKLDTDFWILEGAFAENALFIAESGNIYEEDFPRMDRALMKLIKTLTDKEEANPPVGFCKEDYTLYDSLRNSYSTKEKVLADLRIKLEGPTWHNYNPEVEYQIIGNQPNPGQKGKAAAKSGKSKSTRAKKTPKSTSNSKVSASRRPFNAEDIEAAETLLALSRSGTQSQSVKAADQTPLDVAPAGISPAPSSSMVDFVVLNAKDKEIAQLKSKHRQQSKDFVTNLTNYEKEIDELEARVISMQQAHSAQIALKDKLIQDRDATIAYQNSLLDKYKIPVAPNGNTGKSGYEDDYDDDYEDDYEEDYEEDSKDDFVPDHKRRKVVLHQKTAELEQQEHHNGKSLGQCEKLAPKGKCKGKGKGKGKAVNRGD